MDSSDMQLTKRQATGKDEKIALNIENIRQLLQYFTGTELFSAEIYFLSKLPSEVDSIEVVFVMSMSLFLSLVASLYPSWRAARTDPIEALRNG